MTDGTTTLACQRDDSNPSKVVSTDQSGDRPDGEWILDEVFDLLRNRRRRAVLKYLREHDGSSTLDVLAEHIAAGENEIDVEELSSQQRKRVYISLYQNHLPKMDQTGIVDYDKNRGTVELTDISPVEEYLSVSERDEEKTDSLRHLQGALVVAAVAAIGLTGIGPVSAVPVVVWGATSTVALFALAGIELLRRSE